MTETKFTPGPWYAVQEREHGGTSSDGHYLAKWGVYDSKQAWCIADTCSTWPTEDEEDANAALIAAAPEMYDFVAWFTGYMGQLHLRMLPEESGKAIFKEASMLCAKVRGEVQE